MNNFVYTRSNLVMPLTGYFWPKLNCCTKPFLISGPNFGYILLGSNVLMRLNSTQHWYQCGLICLNTGNLTLLIFRNGIAEVVCVCVCVCVWGGGGGGGQFGP